MKNRILSFLLATVCSVLAVAEASAQNGLFPNLNGYIPGVDMPLVSGVYPMINVPDRTDFAVGTVRSGIYAFDVERVKPFDPADGEIEISYTLRDGTGAGSANFPTISSTGPTAFPRRIFHYHKEVNSYNAIDWRLTTPGTYLLDVTVDWPDGITYTGDVYAAGSETFTLTITVRP